ncbi:hypothetical protein WAI453_005023 [Rhynchosporium graminicola]
MDEDGEITVMRAGIEAGEDQVVGTETVLELVKGDSRFGQHTMLRALRLAAFPISLKTP